MRKPQPFVIRFQKTIGGSRVVTAWLRESAAKHLQFLKNSTPSEIRWAMSGPPMISVRREISGEPFGNLIRLRQMPIDKRRHFAQEIGGDLAQGSGYHQWNSFARSMKTYAEDRMVQDAIAHQSKWGAARW